MILALLFLAALVAGALNSVAGGGSFISFPTLLFAGVPPISANATNTVALWPGSVASAIEYRNHIPGPRTAIAVMAVASLAGGVAGALLLLHTSESTFLALLPWLLLLASLLFTAGPAIGARFRRASASPRALTLVAAIQLVIGLYGGYFGGGIGILMLASLSLLGVGDIHAMNALKTILASIINGIAVVLFVIAGTVAWKPGVVMIAGGILGGYGGAWLARRIEPRLVRKFVLVVAWAMTAWFFVRPHLG